MNAPVSAQRPKWRELLAWGLAALALAAVIFMLRRLTPMHPELVRFQIPAPEGVNLPVAAVSPDGRHLAIANDDGGQIWLRDLDSTVARPLPNTDGARAVFWSPDSHYIAFTSGRKLHKLFIPGGSPETVCEVLAGYAAGSWGSQGTILFAIGENPGNEGIYMVSAQGGTPRKLTLRDESGAELEAYWPHFLPDGLHFLFVGRRLGWERQRPPSGTEYERNI
jgi:Tol biopolymer transport system component